MSVDVDEAHELALRGCAGFVGLKPLGLGSNHVEPRPDASSLALLGNLERARGRVHSGNTLLQYQPLLCKTR